MTVQSLPAAHDILAPSGAHPVKTALPSACRGWPSYVAWAPVTLRRSRTSRHTFDLSSFGGAAWSLPSSTVTRCPGWLSSAGASLDQCRSRRTAAWGERTMQEQAATGPNQDDLERPVSDADHHARGTCLEVAAAQQALSHQAAAALPPESCPHLTGQPTCSAQCVNIMARGQSRLGAQAYGPNRAVFRFAMQQTRRDCRFSRSTCFLSPATTCACPLSVCVGCGPARQSTALMPCLSSAQLGAQIELCAYELVRVCDMLCRHHSGHLRGTQGIKALPTTHAAGSIRAALRTTRCALWIGASSAGAGDCCLWSGASFLAFLALLAFPSRAGVGAASDGAAAEAPESAEGLGTPADGV